MKKYTIVSLVLLASLFGASVFAGEGSGSGALSSDTADADARKNSLIDSFKLSSFVDKIVRWAYISRDFANESNRRDGLEDAIRIDLFKIADTLYCSLVETRETRTAEQLLHSLQEVSSFLRSLARLLKNNSGISEHRIRFLINMFYPTRIFEITGEVMGGKTFVEGWYNGNPIVSVLTKVQSFSECERLASACLVTYNELRPVSQLWAVDETFAFADVAALFFEQSSALLDVMIGRLKN